MDRGQHEHMLCARPPLGNVVTGDCQVLWQFDRVSSWMSHGPVEDDDDYLESLIQENERMKQKYDKQKAKIRRDADKVIELYESRYHYISRAE